MKLKRILVVDDDINTTRLLKKLLERTGNYQVREENSATNTIAAAREFKPDFILLDVCMPDQDGGDVAFRIKADQALRNVPIAFLTSLVGEEDAKMQFNSGGFEFIPKPANAERLIRSIESHLQMQCLNQQTVFKPLSQTDQC